MSFVDRLNQAIAMTGLKKAGVARALGIKPQSITGWLKNGRIDKQNLAHLARLANVPIEAIVAGPMPVRDLPPGVRELIPAYAGLKADEVELMECYRRLDDRGKELLRASARGLADVAAPLGRARQSA